MGDARTHEYSCVLRAVSSTDGMTADFSYFKREFLSETSNKIINEVEGINRVKISEIKDNSKYTAKGSGRR